jgi:hypothetical protein
MNGIFEPELTLIFESMIFVIRVNKTTKRAISITVTMNGRSEWTIEQPGWRPLSFGSGSGQPYLWSARNIIVLPTRPDADPFLIEVDEDILTVFRVSAKWLVVCETSIRLISNGSETDRIELGDVVEVTRWDGDRLTVEDMRGSTISLGLHGDRLIGRDRDQRGSSADTRQGPGSHY